MLRVGSIFEATRGNQKGKGIATALIEACMKSAKEKKVYEVLTITGATGLFEKHGFGTFNKERFALIKIL